MGCKTNENKTVIQINTNNNFFSKAEGEHLFPRENEKTGDGICQEESRDKI